MLLLKCWVHMLGTHKSHVSQVKPIFPFSFILSWLTERLLKTAEYALDWITNSLAPWWRLTMLWRCPATCPYYQNTSHSLFTPGLVPGTLYLTAQSTIDWATAKTSYCIETNPRHRQSSSAEWFSSAQILHINNIVLEFKSFSILEISLWWHLITARAAVGQTEKKKNGSRGSISDTYGRPFKLWSPLSEDPALRGVELVSE